MMDKFIILSEIVINVKNIVYIESVDVGEDGYTLGARATIGLSTKHWPHVKVKETVDECMEKIND